MKLRNITNIIITILVLLNMFQFLWYINPFAFFSDPYVHNEETAISISRNFFTNMRGNEIGNDVFTGEYVGRNGQWIVYMSPPRGYLGRSYIFVIRARDGRVIEFRIAH